MRLVSFQQRLLGIPQKLRTTCQNTNFRVTRLEPQNRLSAQGSSSGEHNTTSPSDLAISEGAIRTM